MTKIVGIVLISLTLTGCAAFDYTKALFVSGVSLEAVGEQFLQVTAQVKDGCTQQIIPLKTCLNYSVFHEQFRRSYPLAVGMWTAADRAGDAATKRKAEDVIRSMSADLARLAAEALNAFAPEKR